MPQQYLDFSPDSETIRATIAQGNHAIFQYLGRDFVLFNADVRLSDEQVSDLDIVPINPPMNLLLKECASASWSAGCDWCFICSSGGILLLNVLNDTGMFCRKPSYKFIEAFIDAPTRRRKARE